MEFNKLHVAIIQDPRRSVECWHFSYIEDPQETDNLFSAHHEVFDMFLSRQPLLVLPNKGTHSQPTNKVSTTAKLVSTFYVAPPYTEFMLNTHVIDLLEGESITEKIGQLLYLNIDYEEKDILMAWLAEMEAKGLYIVLCDPN